MKVQHDDPKLQQLESVPGCTTKMDRSLVRAFRKALNLLRNVANETELYQWHSYHFEKLKGKRAHQRSLRLHNQWRLIVEIKEEQGGNVIVVKGIEDYH